MSLSTLGTTFAKLYADVPAEQELAKPFLSMSVKGEIANKIKAVMPQLDVANVTALRDAIAEVGVPPTRLRGVERGATALQVGAPRGEAEPTSDLGQALKDLTSYIPSEILTFYLAATAAIAAAGSVAWPQATLWTFVVCLLATPLWAYGTVLLGMPPEQSAVRRFPNALQVAWPMLSGTLAFAAYAFAVPGGFLANVAGGGKLFGIIAILGITPVLHLGGQIYTHLFKPKVQTVS